jgi:transcription elongation factor Elf1
MSYCIRIPNGILTFVEVDFNCPGCGHPHPEKTYIKKMQKSKTGLIYKLCPGCNESIGITTNQQGDVVAWLKSAEAKDGDIIKPLK